MKTKIGSKVHPWYKGNHEWEVKSIAEIKHQIEYHDHEQGEVSYDPKIMLLEAQGKGKVLWFTYWISTNKTKGKSKWGQGPPMLEESVLLDLMRDGIRKDLFSKVFLKKLGREIKMECGV